MLKIYFSFFLVISAIIILAAPSIYLDYHLSPIPRTKSEILRINKVVQITSDFSISENFENKPGGSSTTFTKNLKNAFSQNSRNISFEQEMDFKLGNALFRKLWVSSPSSTLATDGLGPLYNARSCQRCHLKDGRGHPPENNSDNTTSLILRAAIPLEKSIKTSKIESYLSSIPDPVYGKQIQDFSIAGIPSEARIHISYDEFKVNLSDNEEVWLRKPSYDLTNLSYGDLDQRTKLSPRVANQMIGLGLLNAIPSEDILAWADPDDVNSDGISGRPNIVLSKVFGSEMLGRFGHKSSQPTLIDQIVSALETDMGISSSSALEGFGDCTIYQESCRKAPNGNTLVHNKAEISDTGLDLLHFYSSNLAVPVRRSANNYSVLKGKEIFYEVGCTSCHRPKFVTHRLEDKNPQSFQLIWPYTDLLLHDLGEGLSDDVSEGFATGREWRTAPLWGIGHTLNVSGHTKFLHDGRARSLLEAILWHDGEARKSKIKVVNMPKSDRDALLKFLESL